MIHYVKVSTSRSTQINAGLNQLAIISPFLNESQGCVRRPHLYYSSPTPVCSTLTSQQRPLCPSASTGPLTLIPSLLSAWRPLVNFLVLNTVIWFTRWEWWFKSWSYLSSIDSCGEQTKSFFDMFDLHFSYAPIHVPVQLQLGEWPLKDYADSCTSVCCVKFRIEHLFLRQIQTIENCLNIHINTCKKNRKKRVISV